MNHEKKGIIIISICFIVLFSMFLIQLLNEEMRQKQSVNANPTPVIYNEIISTNAHMYNVSYSNIAINATYGYGGNGGKAGSYIPIQNVSYSPVNETFYIVAGGGGGAGGIGYYPSVITK